MQLKNAPYSFVDMYASNAACDGSNYPVYLTTDVVFQFVLHADTADELTALLTNHPVRLYYDGSLHQSTSIWGFRNLGNNDVLFWLPIGTGVPEIANINVGKCFRFMISTGFGDYYSDCFIRVGSVENTTRLSYYNDTDQNGFYYCFSSSYLNRIRLPMLIIDESFEGERNQYNFSDGRVYKTFERVRKILHFQTDWLPIPTLDALQAALTSRSVSVISDLYSGLISSNNVIELETNTDNTAMRKTPRANFTAYATPFDMALNSCSECS